MMLKLVAIGTPSVGVSEINANLRLSALVMRLGTDYFISTNPVIIRK
jgi:hypothetical protein